MPIEVINREFHYEDEILPDPDPSMTPQEVISFYSAKYPALVAGHVEETDDKDGVMIYKIGKAIGTKA